MQCELTLRIILQEPPAGVDFGLQRGRGAEYETVQTQRSKGKDLHFEFSVDLTAVSNTAPPDFRGSFVQGPRGQRFVYIDIGTYAGQTETPRSRRLKVPLSGITWALIDHASGRGHTVLETRVEGTGRDGGPTCGTVNPFDGWKPEG